MKISRLAQQGTRHYKAHIFKAGGIWVVRFRGVVRQSVRDANRFAHRRNYEKALQ